MTLGITASYSFPAADQQSAFNDNTLGPTDRMRSFFGFSYDNDPLFQPGIPSTLLRFEDGALLYTAFGSTLDDGVIVLGPPGGTTSGPTVSIFILDDPVFGLLDDPSLVLG